MKEVPLTTKRRDEETANQNQEEEEDEEGGGEESPNQKPARGHAVVQVSTRTWVLSADLPV